MRIQPSALFRYGLAASLGVCALLFFVWTWRWPLVGDTSLMHYIVFLIERGWAPYRQFGDMNMPGSYLVEFAAMHVFGAGALGLRLFDFFLLTAAGLSFFAIIRSAPPRQPAADHPGLAALFAASLFILIHGRDGIPQGAQRDLTMAVCLIAATAFLVYSIRKRSIAYAAAFGVLSGVAFTIKPTAPLLTVAQLALAAYVLRSSEDRRLGKGRLLAASLLGCLVAPAIVLVFLVREHALAAFVSTLRTFVPYYASLGHKPLSFVALHSMSPILPLVIVWLAMLTLRPSRSAMPRDWRRDLLLLGAAFGMLNCIIQARALPYYRYPLLAFLLPLIAMDLVRAMDLGINPAVPRTARSRAVLGLATLGLAFGGFLLAPQSAYLIHSYGWQQTDFISSMEANLETLGGQQLSHKVLCIDTNSGCGNALYLMRLEPSTGMLSDFYLFGDQNAPAVRQAREQLTQSLAADPPQVLVVTSGLYLGGADESGYRKLARWPAFQSYLATHYTLAKEWAPTRRMRWWSREETPASYRIYALRAGSRTHP